ncbi:cell wall hydrolase [Salmonella enterica]|nr:cell wall hydrolase [Salmonella enterica]ELS8927815.1 cell wall hydrolase [Salmonella enterica]
MELFSILATCAALTFGTGSAAEQAYPVSEQECKSATVAYRGLLQKVELSAQDRDAIARVAIAEAANQGDSGLAGVVYTIINRVISGQFGSSVTAVVNAPRQFEPVTKAGGNWQKLPAVSVAQYSQIQTIINLALDGHLPDVTNGGLFFQNPAIVANREKDGKVSKGLTNFGGAAPSAVIKDHSFYSSINQGSKVNSSSAPVQLTASLPEPKKWDIYGNSQFQRKSNKANWNVFSSAATTSKNVYETEGTPQ